MALVEAIGLISGVLGIIQFGIDNFSPPDAEGSTVRVTVGLDFEGGLSNSGGDVPDIRLWNEVGGFLGSRVKSGKVDTGKFADVFVAHEDGQGSQAAYTLFTAKNDAACIAAATITWPNGDNYAWTGDWGRQCGGTWYYSNTYVGAGNMKPDCLWIDANGDQPQTGFQVHWPEFANAGDSTVPDSDEDKQARVDHICGGGPTFKIWKQPDTNPTTVTYWLPQNPRSLGLDERDATAISYGLPKHVTSAKYRRSHYYPRTANGTTVHDMIAMSLVVGDSDEHTPAGLCNSDTSYGPDFINVKVGMFCRMSDKSLWPMCDGATVSDNCFNAESQQLIINGLAARSEPYKKVLDWTSN